MRRPILFALCFTAYGCASCYEPSVDMTGVNPDVYHDDLAACRTKTNPGYTGPGFAGGPMFADAVIIASLGVAGAAVIAPAASLYGGLAMNPGLSESYGAISGAVVGSTAGAVTGAAPGKAPSTTPPPADPQAAIDHCMTDYGYKLRASSS
jgi:hypothetical protein